MRSEDDKQLDLLAVFHYVLGVFIALFSCVPLIHVTIGIMIVSGAFFEEGMTPEQGPPAVFGWLFVIAGSIFVLVGWSIAVCTLIAGRRLQTKRSRVFCMIVAGLMCVFMPFGTVLGVFTLVALNKDSIRASFESSARERY